MMKTVSQLKSLPSQKKGGAGEHLVFGLNKGGFRLERVEGPASTVPTPNRSTLEMQAAQFLTEQTPASTKTSISSNSSRLEALLALKVQQTRQPPVKSAPGPNRALQSQIRMAANWRDLVTILQDPLSISTADPTNISSALYRFGCFYGFMGPTQQAELRASGITDSLLSKAEAQLESFGSGEITHLLDGCTRLKLSPSRDMLSKTEAQLVQSGVGTLDGVQLPLVLWAFASLKHRLGRETVVALEGAIERKASHFTPQGVSLALWALTQTSYPPSKGVLAALESHLRRNVESYKPSELAMALSGFAALEYGVDQSLLAVIAVRTGRRPQDFGLPTPTTKPSPTAPLQPRSNFTPKGGLGGGKVGLGGKGSLVKAGERLASTSRGAAGMVPTTAIINGSSMAA